MEVRVRHFNDGEAVHLCDVDSVSEIPVLLDAMRRHQVATDHGDPSSLLAGQFVVEASGAYFEVIVGGDSE